MVQPETIVTHSVTQSKRQTTAPLPRDFWEIESNLQWPYRRCYDWKHTWHWIWRSDKTNFSARIYPDLKNSIIKIAVYDDDDATPNNGPRQLGTAIQQWSGEIRMTGNWQRRLSRAAGEAMV